MIKKTILLIGLIFLTSAFIVKDGEVKKMMKQALAFSKAMQKGKWEKVAEYTYPEMIKLIGGKRKYLQQAKNFDAQMEREGFKVKLSELSDPGEIVKDDKYHMSIIPMRMTFDGPLGTLYSESSLLAISKDKGENWRFIAMAQTDFAEILELFPNISKDLKFTQSKVYQK